MSSSLTIYNSLSGKTELFKSISPNKVGMYVCGPTVYNNVHLGNCRTFISFDLIYRYLIHLGYKVRYVRNITDVGHLEYDEDQGEDRISKKGYSRELLKEKCDSICLLSQAIYISIRFNSIKDFKFFFKNRNKQTPNYIIEDEDLERILNNLEVEKYKEGEIIYQQKTPKKEN